MAAQRKRRKKARLALPASTLKIQVTSPYILCDTGPLLAIVDREQDDHPACRAVLEACLQQTPVLTLLTTWPCLTEAMHFAGKRGGWALQEQLAKFVQRKVVKIYEFSLEDNPQDRLFALMEKYADRPMDLADASLVVLAEVTGLKQVFTLDRTDFWIYRIHDRETFQILP